MDMRKRRSTLPVLLLVAALMGALVLTACAPSDGNGGNGGNGENGYEPPPRPWIVKFGYEIDFVGANRLDPHGTVQPPLLGCYAEGLIARDQVTGEVQPGLATGWEVAPDWSYIDYFIREGVTFHNGDIMTAEDVKFSFERAMNPDINPVGYYYYTDLIDSLEIINDYQVRIHLKKPAQLLLEGSPAIVPKDYVEEVGDEEFGLNPVGTGPFRVVDWAGSDYVQLEPVEDHWRHTPNYDELMFKVVVESATMYAMLVTGELDMGVILPPLIPNVDANPDLTKVMSTPSTIRAIIFYDMARPGQPSPFLNPDVRKAVSLAIDRVGISENVLYGAYVPWGSYYAPYVLGYRDREPDPYDPDEARRLLAEAGYPDGFDTEFVFPTNYQIESEATIACLQEVGIRVEAKQMESLTWVTAHLLGTHSGIGFTFIPMWSGNRHPLISFAGEVGAFDPVGRTYEEILEAADNLLWATTEEEIIQAAWAAEDLVWSLNYKIPVFAVLGVYAYGPTIEWWQPLPGMEHSPGLEYIRFRE